MDIASKALYNVQRSNNSNSIFDIKDGETIEENFSNNNAYDYVKSRSNRLW